MIGQFARLTFVTAMILSISPTVAAQDDAPIDCAERLWDVNLVSTGTENIFARGPADLHSALNDLRHRNDVTAIDPKLLNRIATAIRDWLYGYPPNKQMRLGRHDFVNLAAPEVILMIEDALRSFSPETKAKFRRALRRRVLIRAPLALVHRALFDTRVDLTLYYGFTRRLAQDLAAEARVEPNAQNSYLRERLLKVEWVPAEDSYGAMLRAKVRERAKHRVRRN